MGTKSRIKTTIKKFYQALENGTTESARPAMIQAVAKSTGPPPKGRTPPYGLTENIPVVEKTAPTLQPARLMQTEHALFPTKDRWLVCPGGD